MNVRIVAGDLLFDPNRITFMTLHFDVIVSPNFEVIIYYCRLIV